MIEKIEEFSEHKIYEGIFNIFERELENIGSFVTFSDGNMGVYSNKIHELHLRVCSEVENTLKIIIHQHFVSKEKIDEQWKENKCKFLRDKDIVRDYEELKAKLGNNKERKKLEELLYGFPDFSFYFEIACREFNLDKKVIKFKAMVSQSSNWEEIQPFEKVQEKNVPSWWTQYNKLKHDKIQEYNLCTFGNLISSMSGFFVLMNYLLKYRQANSPTINLNYTHFSQSSLLPHANLGFCSFQSKLFEASFSYQRSELSMFLPLNINSYLHESITIENIYIENNFTCPNVFLNIKLKDANLKSFEYISPHQNYLKNIFYTYVDYQKVTDFHRVEFWKLGHFGIFSN